eukprot:scaffold431_cov160-Isochrysis_galbana.AAC.2
MKYNIHEARSGAKQGAMRGARGSGVAPRLPKIKAADHGFVEWLIDEAPSALAGRHAQAFGFGRRWLGPSAPRGNRKGGRRRAVQRSLTGRGALRGARWRGGRIGRRRRGRASGVATERSGVWGEGGSAHLVRREGGAVGAEAGGRMEGKGESRRQGGRKTGRGAAVVSVMLVRRAKRRSGVKGWSTGASKGRDGMRKPRDGSGGGESEGVDRRGYYWGRGWAREDRDS